ncbi:MAG: putative porin [Rhodothermales bacterium]
MPNQHMIVLRLFFYSLFCCVSLTFTLHDVSAQVVDTTKTPSPDSLRIALPDSTAMPDSSALPQFADSTVKQITFKTPVSFLDTDPGLILHDSLPTIHPAQDPAGLLSDLPGSFLYDFGASGWPDGWSPYGMAPHDVALGYNGIPFDNSISGTPEYELLPFSVLQPFKLQEDRFGAPLTVNTRLRSLDVKRPISEIRYRQSNNGLKSVLVFHSQQRNIPLRQQMGVLGITLAYGGHGANGEYSGYQLEGARQLLARLRYRHPWGSIELMNFSNRRRLGAHDGIMVDENFYEAIYNRFAGTAINADAQRQTIRNDLALTVRSNVLPDTTRPLTAMGYWTAGTFRYVLGDTLQARTSRFGYRISQAVAVGNGEVTVALEGWNEKLREDSRALPDSLNPTRSSFNLSALTSLPLGLANLEVEPALHAQDGDSFLGGRGRLSIGNRSVKLFAQASYSGQKSSWVQQYGWGDTIRPLPASPESRVTNLRAGISLLGGPFSLDVTGFINRTSNYTDFFSSTSTDSISVEVFPTPVQWTGLTADFGVRKYATRGFYLSITPTFYQLNNPASSAAHSTLVGSLPELYVQGRFGMRYLIFKGDLDLDLYTKVRLWSSFQSRSLHPETGLLVLRTVGSRPVDASVAMDVVLEAGIRTAKLFLAFENVLSHPSLIVGNLLVPDYPLPAQRFRLGIYWPIQD